MRTIRNSLALVLLATCILPGEACAGDPPRLQTNEAYIADAARPAVLDMQDPLAVFAYVLGSLPADVRVLPTENYYYFRFLHAGVPWAGSIRLGPNERAKGSLEFGYYKDLRPWAEDMAGAHREILGVQNGVSVTEEAPLAVRVGFKDHSVLFRLNDLAGVKPTPEALGPDERFLGPIFDESGVRFFFVYNSRAKVFHYVLDESVPLADELVEAAGTPRILVGRRTGFAFYRDQLRERKILIGVWEPNSRLNTYFDGPFDQLPENFIAGEELREAILDADPSVKGQIDRLGNFREGEGRYLINPYMLYAKVEDLARIHTCATQRVKRPDLYPKCFEVEPEPPPGTPPARAIPRPKR